MGHWRDTEEFSDVYQLYFKELFGRQYHLYAEIERIVQESFLKILLDFTKQKIKFL